ncbi:T9SS type A sorting domain-containing protein [Flavobacteriales bacterium]|nr:T9SS type A sorting domain-containing protein [Flavobacteriales bacterium]
MKKLLFLLMFPLLTLAQQTYVPDDNFEAYLEASGMGNGIANDDSVTTSNINTVTNLNISISPVSGGGQTISDLTGIEDFTALTSLHCQFNQLTSLDVSQNTALTILGCSFNGLTSLDVSQNTALTDLNFSYNQLTSIDVSNNTALTNLYCSFNPLSSLDVSQNTALTDLLCSSNQLTNLDVSQNTALTVLRCGINQLTNLDVSNNTALDYLNCQSNQLTNLDVSNNTALTKLWCQSNQLASLDVSNNTALTELRCQSNQLASLDVSNNTALTFLFCSSNQLTSLDVRNGNNQNFLNFNVTSNPNLTCINVDDVTYSTNNWYPPPAINTNIDAQHYFSTNCSSPLQTYVPDDNFEAYLEANNMGNGIANDDSVTTSNIVGITSLDVSFKVISDLTGIEDFTSLTDLDFSSNQLTSLDVSSNIALTHLYCYYNQLDSLDISNNTALTSLRCFSNQLTSLDVSNNTALTILSCQSNQLTNLDVSQNTALSSLRCFSNQLTSLDVSNNTALTFLSGYSNQLTLLDVRNGNNQNLPTFRLTGNPNLTCINVDDVTYSTNNWTNIDVQHYFSTNCFAPNSVQEIHHSISLYPNPTNENVTISINNFNGNIQTEVYDLIGNRLQISNETTISLQDYAKGIYLLKVAYGDRVEEVKVIKD